MSLSLLSMQYFVKCRDFVGLKLSSRNCHIYAITADIFPVRCLCCGLQVMKTRFKNVKERSWKCIVYENTSRWLVLSCKHTERQAANFKGAAYRLG